MKTRWQTLFQKLTAALRDRLDLVLAIMALRHQLAVLERSGKRPHFSPADRCFWVLLSTVWARWITALAIVHADTVRRWKRQGVRHHLASQRRRQRPGRPALAAETRTLIRRISQENRLWGAPRLQGELAKLGVCLSRTTAAKYMARHPRLPSPTWRTFMRHHVYALIVSGAYGDLARTLYVKLISALQRWLSSWTTQRGQRVLTA
jgi:putative transposase